jgi:hypothetical protein
MKINFFQCVFSTLLTIPFISISHKVSSNQDSYIQKLSIMKMQTAQMLTGLHGDKGAEVHRF